MFRIRDRRVTAVTVAVASVLVLAGCSGATSSSPSASTAAAAWRTTTPAAKGPVDSVVWGLPYGEPSTLHWLKAAAFSENTVLSTMCEGLLKETPDLQYSPGLASSVDTPDDMTYVYHLRSGVTFTDGKPMTTADVVYSLKANLDPKVGSFWSGWFTNVTSITATAGNTVTVKLKQPDVLFNQVMATAASTVVEAAYAEKQGDKYGTAGGGVMCTGPYSLTKWTPGTSIVVTKNPTYWDTAHQPKVGTITLDFVTNATTLARGLESGAIDGAFDVPLSTITTLQSTKEGTLYLGKGTGYSSIDFSTKAGPTQNVKVRQAISLMIDKAAVASSVFHGAAEPVRSVFFPSTWSYGTSTYQKAYSALPTWKADLAKGKQLVASVSGSGATLKLLSNADDPAAQQLAAYVQSQASKVGLKVELSSLPASQWIAAAFDPAQQKNYDLLVGLTGYLDVPDPTYWGALTLGKGAYFNSFGYENASVQAWVDEARKTTDPDARAALMAKVEQQAYGTDFTSIAIANLAGTVFMNKRLAGAPATFNAHIYSPWALELGAAK